MYESIDMTQDMCGQILINYGTLPSHDVIEGAPHA